MFSQLNDKSKVWIYQSNREFSSEEVSFIKNETSSFVKGWAAHGNQLFGDSIVAQNRFIILCVDESISSASGCSIDSSVRFIKELGKTLNIDFFNRMYVYIEKDNVHRYVHISDLKNYLDWKVYNPMITDLKQLREEWLLDVSASPFV